MRVNYTSSRLITERNIERIQHHRLKVTYLNEHLRKKRTYLAFEKPLDWSSIPQKEPSSYSTELICNLVGNHNNVK